MDFLNDLFQCLGVRAAARPRVVATAASVSARVARSAAPAPASTAQTSRRDSGPPEPGWRRPPKSGHLVYNIALQPGAATASPLKLFAFLGVLRNDHITRLETLKAGQTNWIR